VGDAARRSITLVIVGVASAGYLGTSASSSSQVPGWEYGQYGRTPVGVVQKAYGSGNNVGADSPEAAVARWQTSRTPCEDGLGHGGRNSPQDRAEPIARDDGVDPVLDAGTVLPCHRERIVARDLRRIAPDGEIDLP